jgi:hypothetical protein
MSVGCIQGLLFCDLSERIVGLWDVVSWQFNDTTDIAICLKLVYLLKNGGEKLKNKK